jgi:hypothetical protein
MCPWGTAQITHTDVTKLPVQQVLREFGLEYTGDCAGATIVRARSSGFRDLLILDHDPSYVFRGALPDGCSGEDVTAALATQCSAPGALNLATPPADSNLVITPLLRFGASDAVVAAVCEDVNTGARVVVIAADADAHSAMVTSAMQWASRGSARQKWVCLDGLTPDMAIPPGFAVASCAGCFDPTRKPDVDDILARGGGFVVTVSPQNYTSRCAGGAGGAGIADAPIQHYLRPFGIAFAPPADEARARLAQQHREGNGISSLIDKARSWAGVDGRGPGPAGATTGPIVRRAGTVQVALPRQAAALSIPVGPLIAALNLGTNDLPAAEMAAVFPRTQFMTENGAVPGTIVVAPPNGVRAVTLFSTNDPHEPKALVVVAEHVGSGGRVLAAAHEAVIHNDAVVRAVWALLAPGRDYREALVVEDRVQSKIVARPGAMYAVHKAISVETARLVRQAVLAGARVFVAACPWGFAMLAKTTADALPAQHILRAVGLEFTGDCAGGHGMTSDRSVTIRTEVVPALQLLVGSGDEGFLKALQDGGAVGGEGRTAVDGLRNLCHAINLKLVTVTPQVVSGLQDVCDALATAARQRVVRVPSVNQPCGRTHAGGVLDALMQVPGVCAPRTLLPPSLRISRKLEALISPGSTGPDVRGADARVATAAGETNRGAFFHPGAQLSVAPRTEKTGGHRLISTGYYALPGQRVIMPHCSLHGDAAKSWSVRIGCQWDVPAGDNSACKRLARVTCASSFAQVAQGGVVCAFGGLVYLERHEASKQSPPFTATIAGGIMRAVQIFSSPDAWAAFECRIISPEAEIYPPVLPDLKSNATEAAAIDVAAADFPPMMEAFGVHLIVSLSVPAVLAHGGPAAAAASTRHMDAVLRDHHALSAREYPTPDAQRLVFDVTISNGYMHSGYPVMAHADPTERDFLKSSALEREGDWGLYHEFGHNHQRGAWTFEGTGEVTVNLFTLHAMLRRHGIAAAKHPWVLGQRHGTLAYLDAVRRAPTPHAAHELWRNKWCHDPGVALVTYIEVIEAFGWEPFVRVFREFEYLRAHQGADGWSDEKRRSQYFYLLSKAVGVNVVGRASNVWGLPFSADVIAAADALPPFQPNPVFH